MCSVHCNCITFGIIFMLIGFIMTMYGFLHEPFYDKDFTSWCEFCAEERETTLKNTKNCRIAGLVFLGMGFVMIIIGCICRKKKLDEIVRQGASRPGTTGYTVTGSAANNTQSYQAYQPTAQYPPKPASYQQYPPPQQGQYPLPQQSQYPPPQQGQYPPQQGQYPPPQQGKYPPLQQGQYPPPPQGQYPHPQGQYPPPASTYQNAPPEDVPPPSYNDAVNHTSAPPLQEKNF